MKTRTIGPLAVLAVTALAAAGCGSTKSSSSNAASAYPSETASNTAASTGTASTSATPTPASTATGGATVIAVKHAAKLGTVLDAGPKHLTVYLFEGDKGAASTCSSACASVWPPVTTSGAPVASGVTSSADLGTITRADGTKQVTYKGHPLYYFARDKDSGDAYGEGVNGFGASWYVVAPSGKKVDNS